MALLPALLLAGCTPSPAPGGWSATPLWTSRICSGRATIQRVPTSPSASDTTMNRSVMRPTAASTGTESSLRRNGRPSEKDHAWAV